MSQQSPEHHPQSAPSELLNCFAAFIDQTVDLFIAYDRGHHIVAINPIGCQRIGRPLEQLIGKTNQAVLGKQSEIIDPFIASAFESGNRVFVEQELVFSGVSYYYDTIYTAQFQDELGQTLVYGVYRDISSKKHLQQKRYSH